MDFWRASSLEEQIDTAAGRQDADLVLKGGHVFNVFLKTWEDADVAISGNKIVGIGKYSAAPAIGAHLDHILPSLKI